MSDRIPVIIGAGQITRRPQHYPDVATADEPADLMAQAVRLADEDTGADRTLIPVIDTIAVPQPLSRRYPDPGLVVARRLEGEGVRSLRCLLGGNSPQLLVNELASGIARGECDVAAIVGAEAMYSRFRAKDEGVDPGWERPDDPPCPHEMGDARPGHTDYEGAHEANLPIHIYPLLETALRGTLERTLPEHQRAVGDLWARFSSVAAKHPLAWSQEEFSGEEIVTPAPGNRTVTFPYTKRMCANMTVDQSAALLLTSLDTARAAGVPEERMVYPLGGADAHDHFHLTERWSLAASPAIETAAASLRDATGIGVDDVARFDIYSCFPSAVQIGARALRLGLADPRGLTLTGGLAFFGGPGNNYVTHSIAEMVGACRQEPGSVGMVTGVGWYLTKHSVGLYSGEPPAEGFRRVEPAQTQSRVDRLPRREPAGAFAGEGVIEATAVVHERGDVPSFAIVSLLTRDGQRALARSDDEGVLRSMTLEAWEGRTAKVRTDGPVNRLDV